MGWCYILFGSGYFIVSSVWYGISSYSDNKTKTWELIKEFLDRENNGYIASISSNANRFDKALRISMSSRIREWVTTCRLMASCSSLQRKKRTETFLETWWNIQSLNIPWWCNWVHIKGRNAYFNGQKKLVWCDKDYTKNGESLSWGEQITGVYEIN